MATNTWQNGSTYNDRYYNAFSYDANACPSGAKRRRGNILTQVRHNEAGTRVENLSYKYERNANGHLLRNRLYHVNETVSAGAFADDIDDQGTFTTTNINVNNNYGYDEEGRLVRDDAEDIAQIKWTVTSKVKEVIRSNGSPKKNLKFDYDASGKRIAKHVYNSSNVWEKSSYYTYDATGNVMAVYEKVDDGQAITYTVAERHMYGSSRIGMNTAKAELSAATALPDTGNYVHLIGKKQFELSNHLGNVLSSISDKLIAKDWNNDQTVDSYKAEILFSQDYTPFGVKMDGRTFTNSYRYGFNGKETDDETGIQDYGFRMYNVLLGRFLSVDPLAKDYPFLTTYQFSANRPIDGIDLDGKEHFRVTTYTGADGTTRMRVHLAPEDWNKPFQVDVDGVTVSRTYGDWGSVELQNVWGGLYVDSRDNSLRQIDATGAPVPVAPPPLSSSLAGASGWSAHALAPESITPNPLITTTVNTPLPTTITTVNSDFGSSTTGLVTSAYTAPASSTAPIITIWVSDGGSFNNNFSVTDNAGNPILLTLPDGSTTRSISGTQNASFTVPAGSNYNISITGAVSSVSDVYSFMLITNTTASTIVTTPSTGPTPPPGGTTPATATPVVFPVPLEENRR